MYDPMYEPPSPDWNEGHAEIREFAADYFKPPNDYQFWGSVIATITCWCYLGLYSYLTLAAVAWFAWTLHRHFRAYEVPRILADGYAMGFEAGYLAAQGISMKQYREYLAQRQ